MRTDREVRSRSASKVAGWSSSGESRKIAVDKNAAQGWFHVIFCHRPRPTARINRGNRAAIPLEGPRSIDAERKIDEGRGRKKKEKGEKREKEERHRTLGGGQAKVGRRLGAKRGWFTCENGQLTGVIDARARCQSRGNVAWPWTPVSRPCTSGRVPRGKRLRRRRRRRRANVGRRSWNSRVVARCATIEPEYARSPEIPSSKRWGQGPVSNGLSKLHTSRYGRMKCVSSFLEPYSIPRPPFRSRNHRAEWRGDFYDTVWCIIPVDISTRWNRAIRIPADGAWARTMTRCVTVSKTSVCRYVEFVYEAREREENTIMVG